MYVVNEASDWQREKLSLVEKDFEVGTGWNKLQKSIGLFKTKNLNLILMEGPLSDGCK
jgi:hypothetical protein